MKLIVTFMSFSKYCKDSFLWYSLFYFEWKTKMKKLFSWYNIFWENNSDCSNHVNHIIDKLRRLSQLLRKWGVYTVLEWLKSEQKVEIRKQFIKLNANMLHVAQIKQF